MSNVRSQARRSWASAVVVALVCGSTAPIASGQDDLADVSDQELVAAGSDKFAYIEIGANPPAAEPADGYKLLLVLPGGDGSRDFMPFVKRIYKYVLGPEYLVAELVAPEWPRSEMVVWPTAKEGPIAAKFAIEKFVPAVVEDVAKRHHKIDRRHVFALGWSSGGPAVYAAALAENPVLTASMPAMSVFFPSRLPPLARAKDRVFYILHSPDDEVCKFVLAKSANDKLAAAGAKVKLAEYPGGHGWQGDVFGNIAAGVAWMDEQTAGR
jgi:predicted esterase